MRDNPRAGRGFLKEIEGSKVNDQMSGTSTFPANMTKRNSPAESTNWSGKRMLIAKGKSTFRVPARWSRRFYADSNCLLYSLGLRPRSKPWHSYSIDL